MVWLFLNPSISQNSLDCQNKNFCASTNNFITTNYCQQTKEPSSPTIRGEQNETQLKKKEEGKRLQENKKLNLKNQKDQQFRPNIPENKKQRKVPQNQNRNIVPNIMHQVISFLQKKSKSQKVLTKLIQKQGLGSVCTPNRFYHYHLLLKDKWNHYVNAQSLSILKKVEPSLIEVYSEEEQKNYNKLSRLLICYFLTQQFNISILTSKRVNCEKKLEHLKTRRKIMEQIMQIFEM